MNRNNRLARAALCVAATALAFTGSARANDRPFQNARTAVVDDDNEAAWSVESWVQRLGRLRGFSVEPEYSFTPYTSVQLELTRLLDKSAGGGGSGHEAEIEFKHLFKDIAAAGWGYGLSLALSGERSGDLGGERSADEAGTRRTVTLKLPVSVALGRSGALLHVNVGVIKPGATHRQFTTSAAAEFSVAPGARGFIEAARDGNTRYAQVGLRHWIRRERLALDFSLQQSRQGAERQSGFVLGLGLYDL